MKVEFISSGGGGGTSISLTTTGTSGASTLSGAGVLNIPVYSGATDTNLGNTNLVGTANRTFTLASGTGTLDIQNSSSNSVIKITSTNLEIGNTSNYTMPNARGTANQILGQTNGTGTIAFRTPSPSITYNAQSPASIGTERGTFGVNTLQVAQQRGDFADLGSTLSPITCTMALASSLQHPFRNIGTTNIQLGAGVGNTDFISIKFQTGALGIYDFYVVGVSMATGSNPASLVVGRTLIGTFEATIPSHLLVQCIELSLGDLEGSQCTNYYVGWANRGGFKETTEVNMIASYNNPLNASITYI